jgi:hypothetical protein
VPTKQRPGRDEEGSPLSPRKEPAEGSEQSAVSSSVLDAAMKLACEDTYLVTEDDQFDIPVHVAALRRDHEPQHTAEPEVDEREDHDR